MALVEKFWAAHGAHEHGRGSGRAGVAERNGRVHGRAPPTGVAAGPEELAQLSDSERASFYMWGDPFANATGRPGVSEEPRFDTTIRAVVGDCAVSLPAPSKKVLGKSGIVFMEGMRDALDERIARCLKEKERASPAMLYQAVTLGLRRSCSWLTKQGLDVLRPFTGGEVQEALLKHGGTKAESLRGGYGGRNYGAFKVTSFTTAGPGKNAVQLALQMGFSSIARQWAEADTVIDPQGRTAGDYIRRAGSAVFADDALYDFGIRVARRVSINPSRGEGHFECSEGLVARQWLGFPRISAFEPYNKCDLDVVDSLTREQYLSEYWATGRPVLVRKFIPDEDLCRVTRTQLLELYGDRSFHMGPQAYPSISGTETCDRIFTLKEAENGAYCDTHPGVSNYYATKLEADQAPFRLASSKTFQKVQAILDIGVGNLNSKQFFFGGDKSGATLHFHAAAFNILHIGQKDWFLVPPSHTAFAGIPSYQLWQRGGIDMTHVARCTQQAGDMLLIPENWGHSTLAHGFAGGLGVLYWRENH